MNNFVCIVNIGTELVDGDVVNSNAAWLSQQLTLQGYKVKLHLSVPDETEFMLNALKEAAATSDFIFVTGGLGPTSDDFTRNVVAQFLGLPLCFDDTSWERIEKLLTARNVKISDLNKRQCFFPEGSEIFSNNMGTADGFRIFNNEKEWVVLPGPPKELQFIWKQHLKPLYEFRVPTESKHHLTVVTTFGESESRLGEIVEKHFDDKTFQIGYRARLPFVDLKFWYRPEQKLELDLRLEKLLYEIEPFVVSRDGADALDELLMQFYFLPQVQVIDAATLGLLTDRVFRKLSLDTYADLRSKITAITLAQTAGGSAEQSCIHILQSAHENFVITVAGVDDKNLWCLGVKLNNQIQTHVEKLKFSGQEFSERNRSTIAELAFIYVCRILSQNSQNKNSKNQKGH